MSSAEWREDCRRWYGTELIGRWGHWCDSWDGLPIDDTCPEELACCECNWGSQQRAFDEARRRARMSVALVGQPWWRRLLCWLDIHSPAYDGRCEWCREALT